MARIARVVLPGIAHHVTQRGVRSIDIFYKPEDREVYKDILHTQCKRFGVKIISYCLMTNHVHFILIPSTESSLARAVGETHRLYTREINFRLKTRGYLFQGRFFSTPLSDAHLIRAIKYVEQNPVRAKMVKEAWEYPYSSAKYYVLDEEDKLISAYEPLSYIEDWKEFLSSSIDDIDDLRIKTRTGRPSGDESFYEFAEIISGRDLKPKKAGRHKNK